MLVNGLCPAQVRKTFAVVRPRRERVAFPRLARASTEGKEILAMEGGDSFADKVKAIEEQFPDIKRIDDWAKSIKLKTGIKGKKAVVVSDLVSEDPDDPGATLQWVNLVMAGGGMLGIAHVGFVRVLELAGVRFMGLGGASAGAINAALIAAVRKKPNDMSWQKSRDALLDVNFNEFEDGKEWFKKLRKELKNWSLLDGLKSAVLNHQVIKDALGAKGAHKGDFFLEWMEKLLKKHGVTETGDLLERMKLKDITLFRRGRDGQYQAVASSVLERWVEDDQDRSGFPLRLVASEVVTQTMAVFPRDADLYYVSPNSAPPADFVRASMSVPVFFQPFGIPYQNPQRRGPTMAKVKDAGRSDSTVWKERHGYEVTVPDQVLFCDGGTLSNFPMRLFTENQPLVDGDPLMPTLGAQFNQDRSDTGPVKSFLGYLGSMFDTSRKLMDREFLFKNPLSAKWVATINTGRYDWLAFDMSQEDQMELMLAGMTAAEDFLKKKLVTFEDGVPAPPKPPKPATPSPAAAVAQPSAAATAAPPATVTAAAGATTSEQKAGRGLSEWEKYKVVQQLLNAIEKAEEGEFTPAVRTLLLQNMSFEQKFNDVCVPAMNVIQDAKDKLEKQGGVWAWGAFLSSRPDELLEARRVTQTFWREVQAAYEPKPNQLQVITDDWWTNNWVGRGRAYRELVEPLDIANWYYSGNHMGGRHYIDLKDGRGSIGNTLEEEMAVDNCGRPGRYLMLQKLEAKAFGTEEMKSSLSTAHQLKKLVGSTPWPEVAKTLAKQ